MGRCYVLVGLLLVACYEPAPVDCAYACGAGDACPDGTTCEGGFCRTPDATGDCPGDLCGNHRMDAGEECDDNDDNTDGCAACRIATCGDGYVHAGDEQCDDANANIDDGCVACNWAYCGDGAIREGVEQCEKTELGCTDGCLSCNGAGRWADNADGHCYFRSPITFAHQQGQVQCALFAGHLYTAVSMEERTDITAALITPGGTEVWVGLHQPISNGAVAWITGQEFVGWPPTALTNEGTTLAPEDCFVQAATTGHWGDYTCDVTRPILCEIESWTIATTVDNHAYKVFYAETTHAEAVTACAAHSAMSSDPALAHLVTFDEPHEQALVKSIVFRDVWVGGGTTCRLMDATGSITDGTCTDRRPYVCEVD